MEGGCVVASYSMKDPVEAMRAYLVNPSLHHEGRAFIRDDVLYKLDGHSGKRIAAVLLGKLAK
jgi:hypothetical protein